jgi:hypothetical protein
LIEYIEEIKINPDFSISARFGRYEETQGFNPILDNLEALEFENYDQAFRSKLQLDAENNLITVIIKTANKYWLVWNGSLKYLYNKDQDPSKYLMSSQDKILKTIISGSSLKYQKLYLSGILSTDITTGLLNLETLQNTLQNTLQTLSNAKTSKSLQNSKTSKPSPTPWDLTLTIYNIISY